MKSVFNKQFVRALLKKGECEYLAFIGQPMLYDSDLYVLRKEQKELSQSEYYRWVMGVRVA